MNAFDLGNFANGLRRLVHHEWQQQQQRSSQGGDAAAEAASEAQAQERCLTVTRRLQQLPGKKLKARENLSFAEQACWIGVDHLSAIHPDRLDTSLVGVLEYMYL